MNIFLTYITAIDSATGTITVASMPSQYQFLSVINVLQMSANRHLQGADGDTLETLSDQLDSVATAAALAVVDGIVDDILVDTGTTLPALIAVGVGPGSSTGYYTDTIDDGTSPLDGVRVQLYTGSGRTGLAYEAYTNALGVFEMWPDPGTYYRWLDLAGYSFTQDVEVEVTEP